MAEATTALVLPSNPVVTTAESGSVQHEERAPPNQMAMPYVREGKTTTNNQRFYTRRRQKDGKGQRRRRRQGRLRTWPCPSRRTASQSMRSSPHSFSSCNGRTNGDALRPMHELLLKGRAHLHGHQYSQKTDAPPRPVWLAHTRRTKLCPA